MIECFVNLFGFDAIILFVVYHVILRDFFCGNPITTTRELIVSYDLVYFPVLDRHKYQLVIQTAYGIYLFSFISEWSVARAVHVLIRYGTLVDSNV